MTSLLIILGVVSLFELFMWFTPLWRLRKVMASVLIIALSMVSGLIAGAHFSGWAIILLVLSLYRMVNLLRLVEGRTQADYLFTVARRSSLALLGMQLVTLGLAWLNHARQLRTIDWIYVLAIIQLAAACVMLASTLRHLRTTKTPRPENHYADRDLPTLSVCIPARNETEDLEACLQSLAANNYPKLEILVLDDCSQDKRTPEIIRSFAQAGIRFIDGKAPPARWLAKNYAYKQLSDEANGEILLFCGVDTLFQTESLRSMVEILLEKRKSMVSFIPRNQAPQGRNLPGLIIQPARYAWELSLPRRWLNRPPVLSTCWMVTSEMLHAAGGFKAVNHNVSPESYFARYALQHDDGYSFLQSDTNVGLVSAKSFKEQRATAIRTRYPQTHRRPEIVGLLSLAELTILVLPFVGAVVGGVTENRPLFVLSLSSSILAEFSYVKIVGLTYRRYIWSSFLLLPVAAIYDIGLLNYSMWRYEFRQVVWKERNVCIPVMHTVPPSPKVN